MSVLMVMCMISSCGQYHSEFYHPDTIIRCPEDDLTGSELNCRVLNTFDGDISDMICFDGSIIFQIVDSTIFKVYDIATGEITASFADIGHAKNEFETAPKCLYKNNTDKNKLYAMEQNGLLTKVIDLNQSIQTGKCVVSDVLKHPNNACGMFYSTFYDDNGSIIFNKDVSYIDARDNTFDPPSHGIIKNNNTISSSVFPQAIHSKIPNNVFIAYANKLVVTPNKKYMANVFTYSDIINIYDIENKEDIAILGGGVKDFAFFQTLNSMDDILNNINFFHFTACGNDKYLFALKTSMPYKTFDEMFKIGNFSEIHQKLLIYDWNKRTISEMRVNHNYPISKMVYEEQSGKLYAIDVKNQLVEFDVNLK